MTPPSIFDSGFIDEHHRDVVLDGVNPSAGAALERRAVLDQDHRRFAIRTGENFKQFWVDGHSWNI